MAKDDDEFTPNPDQPIHQGKWTPEEVCILSGRRSEEADIIMPVDDRNTNLSLVILPFSPPNNKRRTTFTD